MKITTQILTETEACYNKTLLQLLSSGDLKSLVYAKENGEIIDLWNTDPDYIRLPNVEKRIPFVRYQIGKINYVILPDYALEKGYSEETDLIDSDLLRTMLTQFFENDFQRYFKQGTHIWQHFDTNSNGIAFRDGQGYAYSVWDYITTKTI